MSTSVQDSPLSITASIAGILTFVVAVAATAYVRITYLRNADQEYFHVKASLSWFKTESQWMNDLVNAADMRRRRMTNEREYQMYCFVMDQLVKLEERLLSLLTQAEIAANKQPADGEKNSWTFIPQRYQGYLGFSLGTATAVAWLAVRTKALELVRQRDALGSRVQFAQLSMISSRLLDQEIRFKKQEENQRDRLDELERLVQSQHEKLSQLESLVNRPIGSELKPSLGTPSREGTMTEWLVRGRSPALRENLTPFGEQQSEPNRDGRTATPSPLRNKSLDSLYDSGHPPA